MPKKFLAGLIFLGLILSLFSLANPVLALEKPDENELYIFYSQTCPHCKDARNLLKLLNKDYPEFTVHELDIAQNVDLLKSYYQLYDVPEGVYGMVPVFFLNDEFLLGFSDGIKQKLTEKIITDCQELRQQQAPICEADQDKKINFPIIGQIDLSKLGPLALSIILGTLDGFNACAMVALGFLLTVLIATGTRKRVFWVGGTFIFVSGLVYFFFIAAWFNIVSVFWNYKNIVNLIIGLIVIASAIFLLKDYANGIICKICKVDPKGDSFWTRTERKLFAKFNQILSEKRSLIAMVIGVALVAIGINTVELSCSFALPMLFTGLLKNFNLPTTTYYLNLIVYVIFYMLDDFIIFLIAVITLKQVEESSKYLKAIKLISGILLLILGIVMIIKPEILIF
jgi:glutaredoxin/cytochrome c biogenesis protein CcdA